MLKFMKRHSQKFVVGMWILVGTSYFYGLNYVHQKSKVVEIIGKIDVLEQKVDACNDKLDGIYDKIDLTTKQLNKYVESEQKKAAFTESYITPLFEELNTNIVECWPTFHEYQMRVPKLMEQSELETKLAMNPFYNHLKSSK